MIPSVFLATLSGAINRYLKLDPESSKRLHRLAGHSVAIELLPFNATFQCHFTTDGVCIDQSNEAAHTTLRGTPLQLASVMLTKENRHRFFAEDVSITGNMEVGQQVIALFDSLAIDWEEQFASIAGDNAAYHASRLLRRAGNWLKQVENSVTQNVSEYVQEEKNWLPTREALEDFFQDVDRLRMDTDRFEARCQHLLAALNQEEDQP